MSAAQGKESTLTDPTLIGITLDKAKRKHSLLTITIPNVPDEFLSVIIGVDENSKYIYIDELKPSHGNAKLMHGKVFSAQAKLQGVSIGFNSEVIRAVKNGALSSYCVKFPQVMLHRERRSSHRVPIALGLGVIADVMDDSKEPITMRVADMSSEGIGFIAKPEDIKKIMRARGRLMCTVYFPDETEEWTCEIEACHSNRNPEEGEQIHLGAQFIQPTIKQKNILHKQLRFFDRENIRKGLPD